MPAYTCFITHLISEGNLPIELIGEMGVLKMKIEATMTTTRFTVLPTEWVTGETLANIIYDTCQFQTTKLIKHVMVTSTHIYLQGLFAFYVLNNYKVTKGINELNT